MGFRIYVYTKRITSLSEVGFNHSFEELADFISENCPNAVMWDDYGAAYKEEWEVPRNELQQLVDRLAKEPKDKVVIESIPNGGWTAGEVRYELQRALDLTKDSGNFTYPEWVFFTWF